MKEGFYNIIKGRFLASEEASKNWKVIIFLSFLALIMIGSSHSVDRKVRQISLLNSQVKELKSQFVDVRIQYMQSKMESRIISIMEEKGFVTSSSPPQRIRVVKRENNESKEFEKDNQIAQREK